MATVTVSSTTGVREQLRFDPDGSGSPLTIEFPETTALQDGFEFWLVNVNKSSSNSVTFSANSSSPTDEIEDPKDGTASYATSHVVTGLAGYRIHYVLDTENFSVPTFLCLSAKAP